MGSLFKFYLFLIRLLLEDSSTIEFATRILSKAFPKYKNMMEIKTMPGFHLIYYNLTRSFVSNVSKGQRGFY